MNKNLNFIYCFDQSYKLQAFTSVVSLLENLNEKINLHFVVDNNNISYKIPEFIKNHRMLNKLEIKVFKDNDFFFPNLDNVHVSKATYYRMFLENYIPNEVSEAIYVDADTVFVKNPINAIKFNLKVLLDSNKIISARTEQYFTDNIEIDKFERLNINTSYFNAGVMLINLKLWKQVEFTKELIQNMNKLTTKIIQWDQDVLNSTLNGSYVELQKELNFNSNNYKKDMDDVILIHFIGSKKPWNTSGAFNYSSNFYHEYYSLFSKNNFHINHIWIRASILELVNGVITLKILKLNNPLKYLIDFFKSLKLKI